MSSRGVVAAAVLVVVGVIVYLLTGRDDASEPAPEPTEAVGTKEIPGPKGASPTPVATPESARVAVRGQVVTQGEDTPVAGAVVTVTSADDQDLDEPRSVLSNAEGRFEIGALPPGRYAISATAAEHLPAVQRGLEVKDDTSITLALRAGGHPLRGTVSDATGGALEGALVRLTPLAGVMSLRRLDGFGTLSTEDGAYTVHVAPGRYRVDVTHPDYAKDSRTVEVGPGAQSQDFALIPMGTIEGVVRGPEGQGVPNAWVSWTRERQRSIVPGHRMAVVEGSGRGQADAEGRFTLRGLAPGAISLRARAAGVASEAPTVVPLAMAEHVTDVEVRVATAVDLTGRVVAKDDPERGIAGAAVTLMSGGRNQPRATTDAKGNFTLQGVLSGSHTLMASASGWRMEGQGVPVEAGEAPEAVVLELSPAPVIRGRVEPATVAEVSIEIRPETMRMGMGSAMGGSRAIMLGRSGKKTESDEEGRFELDAGAPGPTTVVARVADGRAAEAVVEVGPDGAEDVVIRLEPRSTVRGEVRSGAGDPVAQATVSLRRVREPGAPELRLTINGRDMGASMGSTTEDGRFEIGGVEAGEYEVTVTDRYGEPLPVLGAEAKPRLTVPEGKDVTDYVLSVDVHDGVIAGVVATSDGEPVPDVWVQAMLVPQMGKPMAPDSDDDGPEERSEMRMVIASGEGGLGSSGRPPVLTDDEGRFEITGLRDAEYELMAESGGGRQRVTVTARPGQDVTLTLAELGTIEGNVMLDGQPLKSFTVQLEGPASRVTSVRDSGGHFEISRLDPGAYRLTVNAPDGSGSAEVTLAAGETVRQDVSLTHRVTVTGRIVDPEGAPIVGAMVLLGEGLGDEGGGGRVSISSHGGEEQHLTDEDGRFEVTCAPGPRALLAIKPPTPQPLVTHFFVAEPGQDVDVGELKQREMELKGRVETQEDVVGGP